jgi:exonuclease III
MSYNVRLFNLFKWLDKADVPGDILEFINDKNPDILCIQGFLLLPLYWFKVYRYKYILMQETKLKQDKLSF